VSIQLLSTRLTRAMQRTVCSCPMLATVPLLSVHPASMKMLWITSVIHFVRYVAILFFLLTFIPELMSVVVSDSTPHSWTAPTSVDPTSVDAPYSSYAANSEGTTTLSAPGVYENALNHLGKIYLRRNSNIINCFTWVNPCVQTPQHTLGSRLRMWTRLRWMRHIRAMPPTPFSSQTIREAMWFRSVAVPRPRLALESTKMP
jgi:hypothetical protein